MNNGVLSLLFVFLTIGSSAWAEEKVAIVTYLTWYSAAGASNSCDSWKVGEFGFRQSRASSIRNYPLASQVISTYGSEARPNRLDLSSATGRALEADFNFVREAGFDVVALDVLPVPEAWIEYTKHGSGCGLGALQFFGDQAAKAGLKATLLSDVMNRSGDFPQGIRMNSKDWASYYAEVIHVANRNSWYYKISGLPVIMQFGSTERSIDELTGRNAISRWQNLHDELEAKDLDAYYYMDLRPVVLDFDPRRRGAFIFAPGAPQGYIDTLNRRLLASNRDVVWTVSPGYYNQRIGAFLPPDFRRIHESYIGAMAAGVKKILFITWNDFEEETDIAPSGTKGDALAWLVGFYNRWFKTEVIPGLDSPVLLVATPIRKPSEVLSHGPSWMNERNSFGESDRTNRLFYWVYAQTPGVLRLNGKVQARVEAGVSFGEVPLDGRASGVLSLEGLPGEITYRVEATRTESQRKGEGGLEYRYQRLGG